jgi:2-polyprenyl-3-methyl-5-hydroxy-6-metoxy-1,4-benzoquinol methylase
LNGLRSSFKRKVRALFSHYGPPWLFAGYEWWEQGDRKSLRDAAISRSDHILDLGCGSGDLIFTLREIGFRNVLGADPFIANTIYHPKGVKVLKSTAGEIEGRFDLVMMHHSLEHIWNQREIVQGIARLLVRGGRCIIRIPTIDSWAWEEYGADWVQLDAPRHFYLHSRTSITHLLTPSSWGVVGRGRLLSMPGSHSTAGPDSHPAPPSAILGGVKSA